MSEFFLTKMGRIYYEGTLPALVNQLSRLNRNIEKYLDTLDKKESPTNEKDRG